MCDRNLIVGAVLASATAFGFGAATLNAQDTYAGGAAIAYLPEEFVLGGANPLGVNFAFEGNPFVPIVNASPVPLYDPATNAPTNMIMCAGYTENKNGSYSISLTVQTSDGAPFVNDSTPLIVQTADGPQEATDFVIDLGNGYQLPGFPVDGVDVKSEPGVVYVDVEYWFMRLDGSENREFGDTTGPFLTEAGFTFGWGYDLYISEPENPDNPRNINAAGFIATFFPIGPGCPPECPDLDGNCIVNGSDLSIVLGEWGTTDSIADLDGSGVVDGGDLTIVLGGWGSCE